MERAKCERVREILGEVTVDVEGTSYIEANGVVGYAAGSGYSEECSGCTCVEYDFEYEVVCEDFENEDMVGRFQRYVLESVGKLCYYSMYTVLSNKLCGHRVDVLLCFVSALAMVIPSRSEREDVGHGKQPLGQPPLIPERGRLGAGGSGGWERGISVRVISG